MVNSWGLLLQNIRLNQVNFGVGLTDISRQGRLDLDRRHPGLGCQQRRSKYPESGTDLDRRLPRLDAGEFNLPPRYRFIAQERLPTLLARPEPELPLRTSTENS